jgi:hypothetical protein
VSDCLLHERVCDGKMLIEAGDSEVELFFRHNQWRRDDEVADPGLLGYAVGHHLRSNLIDHKRLAFHLVAHGVERLLGGAILDDLYSKEEAEAADVSD